MVLGGRRWWRLARPDFARAPSKADEDSGSRGSLRRRFCPALLGAWSPRNGSSRMRDGSVGGRRGSVKRQGQPREGNGRRGRHASSRARQRLSAGQGAGPRRVAYLSRRVPGGRPAGPRSTRTIDGTVSSAIGSRPAARDGDRPRRRSLQPRRPGAHHQQSAARAGIPSGMHYQLSLQVLASGSRSRRRARTCGSSTTRNRRVRRFFAERRMAIWPHMVDCGSKPGPGESKDRIDGERRRRDHGVVPVRRAISDRGTGGHAGALLERKRICRRRRSIRPLPHVC